MRPRLLVSALFALLCLPLLLLPSDGGTLNGLALRNALAEDGGIYGALLAAREGEDDALGRRLDPDGTVSRLRLLWAVAETDRDEAEDALRGALKVGEADWSPGAVEADLPGLEGAEVLELRVEPDPEAARLRLRDAQGVVVADQRTGRLSALAPPLIAILLAFLTRSVIPSLLVGVLVGSFLLVPQGAAFVQMFSILVGDILWGRIFSDPFHVNILGFVLGLSATVGVVTRMGGIEGMVRALLRFARSRRSVQAVAYFLGIGIFFDDYANTIIVGNSTGPLFDRLKVSRAKLAYIVDSTAAPVAGVAILSTWVAYQISTYAPQLPTIGMDADEGYSLFLDTIPYRFYCLLAIAMVGLTILMRRNIGPMAELEERAAADEDRDDEIGPAELAGGHVHRAPWAEPRWWNGVVPLFVVMIGFTAFLIFQSGADAVAALAAEGDAKAIAASEAGGGTYLRKVLSEADSTWAIFVGSLSALATAALLALGQKLLTPMEVLRTTGRGVLVLFKDAVLILTLAWCIAKVCDELRTANYLVSITQQLLAPSLLPIILFLTSCFVAFSTGSSWATMAIMQPNVVLLAHRLGEDSVLGPEGLLIISIGSVLEGAIFGDHCSPISDTTVLSSIASRCNHIDHVRTQAPFAVLVALVALLVGYVPVAFFQASPWICVASGVVLLVVLLRVLGKRAPDDVSAPSSAAAA